MLYKEESLSTYTRASDVIINNPLPSSGLMPYIRFNEEMAIKQADGTLQSIGGMYGHCGLDMTPENATQPFDLRHPETDEVIGSATYLDLQVMLYSLYRQATELRDSEVHNDPAIPVPLGVTTLLDGDV